ncbi:MAG: response regulator [Candidatus Brocadia sp. AMX2]|uniref:histidine kinase n=1 Tax=Candidatus Brocadia sinica JPN1 TaxID=1197129 RepID=A0ABQ0JX38_9BACT|nr:MULTISPECIES: response regulator [Brocadia]KXK30280.1 MAG: two-component sensor kinase [Candidatus Brocadia sinica]MBC6933188.1 response regulator [Candidatus Brocadia sp.]MBL1169621.1 response regulator [Candidatus Brocadia sp. AMX1]NOG40857.1 response regulator [Planctomycetota bacterium]KAA0243258.1 MAG: response regulator [Candidatus Brocadia sp. AMX2]
MMNSKILFATNRVEKYGNVSGYLEKKGGFSVIIANDGNEVLRHLDNHVPDFAILDVNLPVLDGFQLCKIMKSAVFRQCETVPVILLSETYGTYMASQLARSVGAYSILHAPFATEDLLLLIHNKLVHGRGTADNAGSLKYKAKVMIVNDDSDVVKQFEHRMGQEGYDVFVEEDAGRVIHAVEIGRPRILFLDCNMPKLNGPEILRWIKGRMPETIVIVMTDRGSEFLAIELMKAGANDYIISPFDIKSVSAICEDSFKKYDMDLTIKRLGEIELKLHSMVEGMVDGVILVDTHGKTTRVNGAGKEMLRYLDINRTDDGSLVSLNSVGIKEIYHEIFSKKQPYVSFEIHTKGDNEKHFVVVASPVNGVGGEKTGVIIVLRDVTREYQLQEQIIRSERLYAVSNLVAGAAHELNNPLAGIQLCTDLVLNDPSISEKAKKYLNRVQKEAEQIQSVIKSLLTLTGNYTLSKERVNTNEIIEEIVAQKANQFDYVAIKVAKLLDEKLPLVFVDKHQMRRVFLNIIENACTSMAGVRNERCLTIQTEGCKDTVKIMISDTGPGIPEEYLTKIFEPFFTAKNIKYAKGTGLGLSIAHSIVHQHNGRIYAKSKLGTGATFVIELPVP